MFQPRPQFSPLGLMRASAMQSATMIATEPTSQASTVLGKLCERADCGDSVVFSGFSDIVFASLTLAASGSRRLLRLCRKVRPHFHDNARKLHLRRVAPRFKCLICGDTSKRFAPEVAYQQN